jgi:hypothetical protein
LLELAQTLHLLQDVLQQLLAAHDVEVSLDLGVFFGEAINFFAAEASA